MVEGDHVLQAFIEDCALRAEASGKQVYRVLLLVVVDPFNQLADDAVVGVHVDVELLEHGPFFVTAEQAFVVLKQGFECFALAGDQVFAVVADAGLVGSRHAHGFQADAGNTGSSVVDILDARHPRGFDDQRAFTQLGHLAQAKQADNHQHGGQNPETQTGA